MGTPASGSALNRLRKECLNRNRWNTLFEARVVIGDFKHEPNHAIATRPWGYPTPAASLPPAGPLADPRS